MRRFERIYYVVEWVEEYRVGGYHPVHLEDLFQERYLIVGKWAYGEFSTVWLAEDLNLERYVTLKILKADVSNESRELAILQHISTSDPHHPGKNHVLQLLDYFEHEGPNGVHLCLVFPVMLSDGQVMTVRRQPRNAGYVREISRQILLGLDFLHEQNLIHSDLQPANILFTVDDDEYMESLLEPEFSPVNWLPGVKVDDSAPEYLMTSQRPRGMLDDASVSALTVKVGDLGGALWSGQYDVSPVTPTALRAPELLEGGLWDVKIDIWTLGCLIFQLATNEPLFPIGTLGCTREEVFETLRSQIRNLIESGKEGFAAYLGERLPSDFGIENIEHLADFLWSMLQERPQERKSTTMLLDHPFLVE